MHFFTFVNYDFFSSQTNLELHWTPRLIYSNDDENLHRNRNKYSISMFFGILFFYCKGRPGNFNQYKYRDIIRNILEIDL